MRRKSWAFVFTAMVIAGGQGAASAHASAPAEWQSMQAAIAAPYPDLMTADGRFDNYLHPGGRPVAVPHLGLALIQVGLQRGHDAQLEAGLRTINDYVQNKPESPDGVFDHVTIASAYNLVRDRRPDHPLFTANQRAWEDWLRRQPLHWLPNRRHYANKYMVEVVAVLESRRTGLTSTVPGSAMARGAEAEALAIDVLDRVAPAIARNASTRVAGKPAMVLSDPSNDALAYHGLTPGFLGRAVELLGSRASARARDSLQRVARASWALTAPDGDLAYIGRSQQQAWALAMTAYGAEVAAADADATWAPRFHAVADRALTRLRTAYGVGAHGISITPSGTDSVGAGRHGLDTYANGQGYGGLTLTGLSWAVDHAERHTRSSSELASDRPATSQLGRGRTVFHVVRAGSSWFAVKRSRSSGARDLRYDFGLVALKRPAADGGWTDVVRPRPHTTRGADSAGPVLIGRGGRALPDGTRSRVSRGVVTVSGGYRSRNRRWLTSGETFRFAPVGCGVRATFTRRSGGVLEYSVFFRGRPNVAGSSITGDGIAVDASPRPSVQIKGGYASATDARLVRAVLRFPASRRPVHVTICGG